MTLKGLTNIAALIVAFGATVRAEAVDWAVQANIVSIEVSYMPQLVAFKIDTPIGACPAGAILRWYPEGSTEAARIANVNAAFATVLTAKQSGSSLALWGDNTECAVRFMHIL